MCQDGSNLVWHQAMSSLINTVSAPAVWIFKCTIQMHSHSLIVTHDDTLKRICPEAENSTMGGYSNNIQMHNVKLVMHS